jgi:hypothetical protein
MTGEENHVVKGPKEKQPRGQEAQVREDEVRHSCCDRRRNSAEPTAAITAESNATITATPEVVRRDEDAPGEAQARSTRDRASPMMPP